MSDGITIGPAPVRCISYLTWMSFNADLKRKLVALFEIPRSGETIVRSGVLPDGTIGSEVQSDGYTIQDLQAISLEKLQEFLGVPETDDNFYSLLETLVKNIDDFVEPTDAPEQTEEVLVQETVTITETVTEEFVPAPYEDLLKKKEPKPKTGTHAKTTKAKGTKTK